MNWIKLEDEKPPNGETVLTFGEEFDCSFGVWEDGKFFEGACLTENMYDLTVTHWARLDRPV